MVKKLYYKHIKKSSSDNAIITVADSRHRDKNLGMIPLTKKIHKKIGALPGDIIEIRHNEKII